MKKVAKIMNGTYKLHIKSAPLAKYLCRGIKPNRDYEEVFR